MEKITENLLYVGLNDYSVDLFEGQYKVPNGISYNSYIMFDEKIAVFDSVDQHYVREWLNNVEKALKGKSPDYIIVSHMEPDHSSGILEFVKRYPKVKLIGNSKTFIMLKEYFNCDFAERSVVVKDGDTISLGKRTLKFIFAPMVHWPEVMMSYCAEEKTIFSADAFGKFGALDTDEEWDSEARRYYIGIVGKYGMQVQSLFKKIEGLELMRICPLHGPVLSGNLEHYLKLYNAWSLYVPEEEGILIAYTSVYGNTERAAELLKEKLLNKGVKNVKSYDLARNDLYECVAQAFRYSKLVLATTTYNGDIFPAMRTFVENLVERNFKNRFVAIIENGSWSPVAAKVIRDSLATCKNLIFAENSVKIRSALNKDSLQSLENLANELTM